MLFVNTHTWYKWRPLKNTCLLFKCVWEKVENSEKIREFCEEQNVETMNRIFSSEIWFYFPHMINWVMSKKETSFLISSFVHIFSEGNYSEQGFLNV